MAYAPVKILLADDDREDAFIMSCAFKDINLQDHIHYVQDGEAVLRFLDSVDSDADLPRLIILDLNMPLLNGTETLQRLKASARYQHISVIIFSTSVNQIERAICLDAGATAYVTKPVRYEQCLEVARYFADCVEQTHGTICITVQPSFS